MNFKYLSGVIPFLCIGFLVNYSCTEKNTADQPNIIFIVADDMGAWALGADRDAINSYTPNLDKMAGSGVIFNNCFSCGANCSPSRASLITGRYPGETGVTDILGENDEGGLSPDFKTFPEVLRSGGYNTVLVGKWHLGHKKEYMPLKRGYDRFSGFPTGGRQSLSPAIMVEDKWHMAEGEYTSDLLTDYAISYIRELNPVKTEKPFLLSLHYWAPHANTDFPEGMEPKHGGRSWLPLKQEDLSRWDTLSVKFPDPDFPNLDSALLDRMIREYHSSVHSVDRNIGRLLDFLKSYSLLENTMIVFTSDHGYMSGHNGLWHKGRGWWMTKNKKDPEGIYGATRDNVYDNSIRVPCIVYWPGVIHKSFEVDATVSFVDWFPTLISLAGIKKPEDLLLRGRSILPLLKKKRWNRDNDLYAEFTHLRTYRTPEWKLVMDFSENSLHELYDLKNDKNERHNLYRSNRDDITEIKRELQGKLIARMEEINDPLLEGFLSR